MTRDIEPIPTFPFAPRFDERAGVFRSVEFVPPGTPGEGPAPDLRWGGMAFPVATGAPPAPSIPEGLDPRRLLIGSPAERQRFYREHPSGPITPSPSPPGFTFFLGAPEPGWLARTNVPLFVSIRRLVRGKLRRSYPRAIGPWAMDSGAFSFVESFGDFPIDAQEYPHFVSFFARVIGGLEWAAPQDIMCETFLLDRLYGIAELSAERAADQWARARRILGRDPAVAEALRRYQRAIIGHQEESIARFLLHRRHPQISPVLQGLSIEDYVRMVRMFRDFGIDLRRRVVGVGSVCRRQETVFARELFGAIRKAGAPHLHAFGYKATGLRAAWRMLASSDSMAWSLLAYRRFPTARDELGTLAKHSLLFALRWRERLLAQLALVPPRPGDENLVDVPRWRRQHGIPPAEEMLERTADIGGEGPLEEEAAEIPLSGGARFDFPDRLLH